MGIQVPYKPPLFTENCHELMYWELFSSKYTFVLWTTVKHLCKLKSVSTPFWKGETRPYGKLWTPTFQICSHPCLYVNRHELDLASERLSAELKKLDRHVSTAVIDHVTTVFADAELPVHNMIQAATASLLVRLET